MTTTRHQSGDEKPFAAWDFGDESVLDFRDEPDHYSASDLDFGDEANDYRAEQSVVDALGTDEQAGPAGPGTGPSAIDALPGDIGDSTDRDATADESSGQMDTVTNPPENVSVTALMGGSIHSVELSADAGRMTESELAAEILVVAGLASQKAGAVLHTLLTDDVRAQGVNDHGILSDLLGPRFMNLPSPKQAAEAQAEVFATRYASDQD